MIYKLALVSAVVIGSVAFAAPAEARGRRGFRRGPVVVYQAPPVYRVPVQVNVYRSGYRGYSPGYHAPAYRSFYGAPGAYNRGNYGSGFYGSGRYGSGRYGSGFYGPNYGRGGIRIGIGF